VLDRAVVDGGGAHGSLWTLAGARLVAGGAEEGGMEGAP
jgi:hypothetical protein